MSVTLRKAAGTAVLALAASALTLPLAPPASASTPTEKAFVVSDTDNDDFFGLSTQPTPTGSSTAVVSESLPVDIHDLSSSADGSRVIYVQTNFSASTGEPTSEQVLVRDVSTRLVRALETRVFDGVHFLGAPALSPDGSSAVWELYDDSGPSVTLRKSLVGSGGPSTLHANLTPYGFLSATTVLAQDFSGNPYTLEFSGGTIHAVTGLPVEALNVAISPSGTRLAWGLYDTSVPAGQPLKAPMQVATVSLTSGVATVSNVATISTGLYNKQPSFSRDSNTVYWVRNDGTGLNGDIWSGSFDGTTTPAAATATTAANEKDVAITITDDGTAPAGALALPSVLNGTTAWLYWSLPADADLSGVQITCKHGTTVQRNVFVAAPVVTYADAGLALNNTYTCTYTAVDRSGNAGPVASRNLTALKAAPTFADPTSTTSAKAPFPVSFAPVGTPNYVKFDVDYVPTTSTTWRHWVVGATGRVRTFGIAATLPVYSTTSTPGTNYVYRVRATDAYGNLTPFVSSAHAVVPYDQTKATLVGGTNISTTAAYLGSYRRLSKTTDYARITVVGNRLQVVGIKCSSCGSFDVYDGSTRIATISSYTAGTSIYRAVLFTRTYTGTHTFTIKPKATTGHPYVMLDGFGMRR